MMTQPPATSVPILSPPPVAPEDDRARIEEEHELKLQELKDSLLPELTEQLDLDFCDDACCLRYLRATKWNVAHAKQRLEATLKWRKEFKPHEIDPEEIKSEAMAGRQFFNGFDKKGRPVLYLIPGRENPWTKGVEHQLKFVVYNLEKAIQLMPPGVETMVIVIDYKGMSLFNSPSPTTGRKFLSILGDHYPERLGLGLIINPTWYIWTFFTLLGPFLDPVTKAKIHIVSRAKEEHDTKEQSKHSVGHCSDITYHIDRKMLMEEYGGEHRFEWHFETYWEHINQ